MNTDFPDSIFLNETANYQYAINAGTKICKNKSIIFCGIARDVAENLQLNIDRLHRTGKMFHRYQIFIYENDSKDETRQILEKNKSAHLTYLSEAREDQDYRSKLDTPQDPWHYNRCKILSDCRNKYIEYIHSLKEKPDYICVLDCDLKGGWSYNGFKHSMFTLEQEDATGCVSAYGVLADKYGKDNLENHAVNKYIMYDSFAFRPLEYLNTPLHMLKTPMFNNLVFTADMEPIEVCSNFGGMAIYKTRAFLDGEQYSAKNWADDFSPFVDPDHVSFHRNIIAKNWKVLLNPAFIVSYSHHKFSQGS
jgi:hypothetical protein